MEEMNKAHELSLQILQTRLAFRQAVQKNVRSIAPDMTFEMLQVLNRLWTEDCQTQQMLANMTAKDKTSMTKLIDNLIKRGWVERKEDANDRRNRLICLTEQGKRLSLTVKPVIDGVYESLGKEITDEEMEACLLVLKKAETLLLSR